MQHIFRSLVVLVSILTLCGVGLAVFREQGSLPGGIVFSKQESATSTKDIVAMETVRAASAPALSVASHPATSSTMSASLPAQKEVNAPGTLTLIKTPAPVATSTAPSLSVGALNQADIIMRTNKERSLAGLAPLAFNETLSAIARVKAEDMIARQYFAHVSPTGVDASALAKTYGYAFLSIGENLALGDFASSQEVVAGWMNSPGHRANILGKQYTEIGVAAIMGNYEGRPVWFAVQEFGRPQSDCAPADPALKQQITIYQGELVALESTLSNLKKEIDATTNDQNSYNAKVKDYNTIVALYNTTTVETKTAIARYNALVDAYNFCITPR